jgi:uncharacterized protein YvpB
MRLVKPDWDYYSQRNNEIDPLISCQVTAMIQALDMLGCRFPEGKHGQPEDNLRAFLKNKKLDPEAHYDLSRGVNEWLGKKATVFSTGIDVEGLKEDIKAGRPAVLSGTFPGHPTERPKPLGHIVTMAGYGEEGVIIIDPYGDTLNDWKGSGKKVLLTWERFNNWIKPAGNPRYKWAHLFF